MIIKLFAAIALDEKRTKDNMSNVKCDQQK